jgi:Cd2+/Zn2+-exporting ATPase
VEKDITMKIKYSLKNLDCANCALKIENHLKNHSAVRDVSVNFATLSMHIDTDDIETIRREVKRIEPKVDIVLLEIQGKRKEHEEINQKKEIVTISIAFLLFLVQLLFEKNLHKAPWGIAEYSISLSAYLLAGWNVLSNALNTIRKGRLFDENVLMAIATIGAFVIHAISEAVGVMIFYKIGEFLQGIAVSRSRKSIKTLLEIQPNFANLKTPSGIEIVAPEEVKPGEIIVVKAGEKIPLDGVVIEGTSLVNTSVLTGESVPSNVKSGDVVLAGEINTNGLLTVQVTKIFADSSISKILNLVENATAKKAKTENFISQFAYYYTPVVVFLAFCIAVIPPLFLTGQTFSIWIYRALVLLVISCPCALVISIPLGYFGGIGGASRKGILVKGSNYIDALANVEIVVFDKTGTLTKGVFKVKNVVVRNGFTSNQILSFASLAESHSNHPIAKSICAAADKVNIVDQGKILEYKEIAGHGVMVKTKDNTILVGNDALLHREEIDHDLCDIIGTVVHVSINEKYAGYIIIGDEIKDDASIAISRLRDAGVKSISMLTGDNTYAAEIVAEQLGLDSFHAELLPEGKVAQLESILQAGKHKGKVAFVGDGINDAPVLARADIGIAMGAFGSDAAIETADVVLMSDHPSKVADAISIGKKTNAIVWQNIIFALAIKVIFISFGAFGLTGMWEAVFADMGTALIAVLNSTRALKA